MLCRLALEFCGVITAHQRCTSLEQVQQVYANGDLGVVCCAGTCGSCGGAGCSDLPGGHLQCCTARIEDRGVLCAADGYATVSTVGCLALDDASPPPSVVENEVDCGSRCSSSQHEEGSARTLVAVVVFIELGIVVAVVAVLFGINRCIKIKKQSLGPGTRVSDSAWLACVALCMCNLGCFMWVPFVVSAPPLQLPPPTLPQRRATC